MAGPTWEQRHRHLIRQLHQMGPDVLSRFMDHVVFEAMCTAQATEALGAFIRLRDFDGTTLDQSQTPPTIIYVVSDNETDDD